MRTFILSLLLAFASGCVYVSEIERPDGSELVEINTTGWYLFDLAPIITGDVEDDWTWFTDTCDAHNNMKQLDKLIVEKKVKRIGPVTSHEVDEGVLVFLLNRHEFRTSVVLYKD